MIVKVCGLRLEDQIEELDLFKYIDWLGFIFYEKSKRYIDSAPLSLNSSKKVGVFVNEELESIVKIAEENKLDILQLHGDEKADFCLFLKSKYVLVKAFGMDEDFDFKLLADYEGKVDYFLFDTKTKGYGGSGNLFDWSILNKYNLSTPFFLSGGISMESLHAIKKFQHKSFIGIDLNSKFENNPGDKNIELVKTFLKQLNDE
jgi:phosphoribosylanthranilate isomerase